MSEHHRRGGAVSTSGAGRHHKKSEWPTTAERIRNLERLKKKLEKLAKSVPDPVRKGAEILSD